MGIIVPVAADFISLCWKFKVLFLTIYYSVIFTSISSLTAFILPSSSASH